MSNLQNIIVIEKKRKEKKKEDTFWFLKNNYYSWATNNSEEKEKHEYQTERNETHKSQETESEKEYIFDQNVPRRYVGIGKNLKTMKESVLCCAEEDQK